MRVQVHLRDRLRLLLALVMLLVTPALLRAAAAPDTAGEVFRLYEGITAYVYNPEGKDFTVGLDVRDINLYANGPREVLYKIYDPDGKPVVRESIPDDGCSTSNMQERVGGWDHEMQSYVNTYAKGDLPWIRWSAWSDPGRLNNIVKRNFDRQIKGGKKGVYRIVLAGTADHYVTLRISPDLKYGIAGHPSWRHGHGNQLRKSFIYVPKGVIGLFFAVAEPEIPQSRKFKLTAPDGAVLYEGVPTGGYFSPTGDEWKGTTAAISKGEYEGKLLTLEVSDGPNDFLVKVNFVEGGGFADYVGMGSTAIFCADEALANALQGGTTVVDGQVFWHPFQVRFYEWLKANKLDADDKQKALRKILMEEFNGMRTLEVSDGRGTASWANWAYAMGYYGCRIFRPGWLLMKRDDVPAELKAIIKEGLIMAGDRLGYATAIEKVNGNAFSQIPVALWYSKSATGDAMQSERFEIFWQRWTTQGWGQGSGLSPSGDSQEHFAHDLLYGSYIMNNWSPAGDAQVPGGGILGDAVDDPRFQKVMDRYYELYSYLYCREAKKGGVIPANAWSSRTNGRPSMSTIVNYDSEKRPWKGDPGPDFTVDVNDGHEWFAARRNSYYALTFHGRLAPAWLCETFTGQIGFGGGMLCQLTVPGRGPVITSILNDAYGKGMHPTQWLNFHIHSLVGERWDGVPVVSGISEHDNARLNGNTLTSSGEIRGTHLKVTRSYTFNADSIDCSVQLAKSDYVSTVYLWGHEGSWSEMRVAAEMIPFEPLGLDRKTNTKVSAEDGAALTTEVISAKTIRIDRGGFGVDVVFEQPVSVKLGQNNALLIMIVEPAPKPTPADRVGLKYKLVPFGALDAEAAAAATAPAPKAKAPPAKAPAASPTTAPAAAPHKPAANLGAQFNFAMDTQPTRKTMNVLFIGNSQMMVYDLPHMIESMSAAAPEDHPRIKIGRVTLGGASLKKHWEAGDKKGTPRGLIAGEKWDFVIIQEIFNAGQEEFEKYATLFEDAIRKSGAVPILFATANVNKHYAAAYQSFEYPASFEKLNGMQISLGKKSETPVAAAGHAWMKYLGANPTEAQILDLYHKDKGHPGYKGTYIYACLLYAHTTGKNPAGLISEFKEIGDGVVVSAEEAVRMQAAAWRQYQEDVGTARKPI